MSQMISGSWTECAQRLLSMPRDILGEADRIWLEHRIDRRDWVDADVVRLRELCQLHDATGASL